MNHRPFYLAITLPFFLASCGQAPREQTAIISTIEVKDTMIRPMQQTQSLADQQQLPIPTIAAFIPKGYSLLDSASGDLNLDPYTDMILVLKKDGEDTTSEVIDHPEKRPLLILTGQADHSFKLAAKNDNAVYCVDCGGQMGDPFTDIVIKNGYFSVEHYGGSGWRWTRTITFKYSPEHQNWVLHKDGSESFHATDPEKVTTKIQTRKDFGNVPFEQFDIYKEKAEN